MNCKHQNTEIVTTQSGPHHAKEICRDCGLFLRWMPKPETIERRRLNAEKIATMLSGKLTLWERNFLSGLPDKPSPKQQEIVDRMWADHANR